MDISLLYNMDIIFINTTLLKGKILNSYISHILFFLNYIFQNFLKLIDKIVTFSVFI